MTTIRDYLEELEFDWSNGIIVTQLTDDGYEDTFYDEKTKSLKFNLITDDYDKEELDKLLDFEFDDGCGCTEMPCFIAEDSKFTYVVGTYDGSTWVEKISKDLDHYLNLENDIPYIGG